MYFKALVLIFFTTIKNLQCEVYIKTKIGTVKGAVMLSRDGNKFDAFLGIPYAKPPIRELRFQDPVLYDEPWNGILDGTKYPSRCPQMDGSNVAVVGQEDCLHLNVYVPRLKPEFGDKLPVWVYIFGSRRVSGHVAPYKHGPHYIMDKPVVFITMTYRIGFLGYLSTEDNVIPGNAGLKDQATALKWIQEYIDSFGGDPTNVTLTGGSTGASDVGLHLYSPMSKGLFQRAISQSGPCHLAVSTQTTARRNAWRLARYLKCDKYIKTSEQLFECLKSTPTEMLVRLFENISPPIELGSVIESSDVPHKFIDTHPALKLNTSRCVPWILGMNSQEGSIAALGAGAVLIFHTFPRIICNDYPQNPSNLLQQFFDKDQRGSSKDAVLELVTKKCSNDFNRISYKDVVDICGFFYYFKDTAHLALQYSGQRYFYIYEHENKVNYFRNYYLRGLYSKEKIGSSHGEELRSLQHYPSLFPPILDGEDRIVSDNMIKMWYNFVAYGNPNGKNKTQLWKPVTPPGLDYLHIYNSTLKMRRNPFWEDYQFVENL